MKLIYGGLPSPTLLELTFTDNVFDVGAISHITACCRDYLEFVMYKVYRTDWTEVLVYLDLYRPPMINFIVLNPVVYPSLPIEYL